MHGRFLWAMIVAMGCLPVWADSASAPSSPNLAEIGPLPKPIEPPSPQALEASIGRGVAFLLKRQNKDGSWGSVNITRPSEIYAPSPGSHQAFHAAVTAMCISALIETGGDTPESNQAIDRAETWLMEHLPKVRRATPDVFYNTWTHAYAIQALVDLFHRHANDADRQKKIRELIEQQIGMLGRYEVVDGGWAYYDMNAHTQKPSGSTLSFVTATVLVAFYRAKEIGIEIPQKLVDRATASIVRQQNPDFSYFYGEYLKSRPMREINRPAGSLGRSQACNLALRLWGDEKVTDAVLKTWLNRLFARNLWLDLGRKHPIPHESWCQVAGYFYYYGHYYAALCIDELPENERKPFQDHLAAILLPLQESDGSWWDFPLFDYHTQYGTAFALMSLHRCQTAAKNQDPPKEQEQRIAQEQPQEPEQPQNPNKPQDQETSKERE
jgi:squalene cyclase